MVIKYFFIGIIVLLSFFFISCQSVKNPKERNFLVFVDNIKIIEDRISALNRILDTTKKHGYTYGIDNNILYIEGSNNATIKMGFVNDNAIYKSDSLDFIKKTDRFKFVELIRYLYENKISRCSISDNQVFYSYREDIYMADMQEDLWRFIVYAENDEQIKKLLEDKFVPAATGEDYNLGYKILDKKGKLYLLARKNALIWADN